MLYYAYLCTIVIDSKNNKIYNKLMINTRIHITYRYMCLYIIRNQLTHNNSGCLLYLKKNVIYCDGGTTLIFLNYLY